MPRLFNLVSDVSLFSVFHISSHNTLHRAQMSHVQKKSKRSSSRRQDIVHRTNFFRSYVPTKARNTEPYREDYSKAEHNSGYTERQWHRWSQTRKQRPTSRSLALIYGYCRRTASFLETSFGCPRCGERYSGKRNQE